jgi:tetratricopeptide (TPR) repeat protein
LYGKQERIKDAADTLAAFVRRQPLHAQAPLLQARVVDIYANNGFATLALAGQEGPRAALRRRSEFRRANPSRLGRRRSRWSGPPGRAGTAPPRVGAEEPGRRPMWMRPCAGTASCWPVLARRAGGGAAAASCWPNCCSKNQRHADAAVEYETVAYRSAITPGAARAADAGYSALLAYAALEKAATDRAPAAAPGRRKRPALCRRLWQRPACRHRAGQRGAAARRAGRRSTRLPAVARQALALQPPAPAEARRVAWVVIAHQAFDGRQAFAAAEQAYGEVLALTPEGAAAAKRFVQRQAAAIYRQAELAREQNRTRAAAGHFARVANLPPLAATATLRASALYDRAAALIALKDWRAPHRRWKTSAACTPATRCRPKCRPSWPWSYLELGRGTCSGGRTGASWPAARKTPLARGALWQAAELHQQAARGAAPKSAALATATVPGSVICSPPAARGSRPCSARWQLARLARQDNQPAKATAWLRAVQQADAQAGEARTPRTRSLGGQAALQLAAPLLAAYQKVPLTEPLQRQLKLKKARMETLLKAYAEAADVGALDVTTQATFQTGALYQDFGRALLKSQRPRKLNKAELEQYNVMLEEQAFPFEEKAIDSSRPMPAAPAAACTTLGARSLAELAR